MASAIPVDEALLIRRAREGDKIKILNLPDAYNIEAWKAALRIEIVSTSGRGDEAYRWIDEVFDPDKKWRISEIQEFSKRWIGS